MPIFHADYPYFNQIKLTDLLSDTESNNPLLSMVLLIWATNKQQKRVKQS
jgi:hypothetical protein